MNRVGANLLAGTIIVLIALLILGASGGFAATQSCGLASWYGTESGTMTANGEHFDGSSMTAAHKSLPFGAKLKVHYRGRAVIVRINDRGPFIAGRILDLSHAAAAKLGLTHAGVGRVCFERLSP